MKRCYIFETGGPGGTFCEREANNFHSEVAVMVKSDTDGCVIGHIPNDLAVILVPLFESCVVTSIMEMITGPPRSVPEGIYM